MRKSGKEYRTSCIGTNTRLLYFVLPENICVEVGGCDDGVEGGVLAEGAGLGPTCLALDPT